MDESFFPSAVNPYSHLIEGIKDGKIKFFNPQKLNDPRYGEFESTPSRVGNVIDKIIHPCLGGSVLMSLV